MASCNLPGQYLTEQFGNIVNEEIIYGVNTDFDYQGGLIGACEQVIEETIPILDPMTYSSSCYTLPEYAYADEVNFLNVQNTEEIVASDDYQENSPSIVENFYPCEVCGRRFSVKINLDNHMTVHDNERSQICNLCGVIFIGKSNLLAHLKTHASVPVLKVNEDCNNNPKFEEKTLRPKKKSKTKITCGDCNSEFDVTEFDDHVCGHEISSSEEKNDSDYVSSHYCKLCNKDFVNKTRLTRHLMSHRSKMSCNICGDKFINEYDLVHHMKLHKKTKNGEKIFDCKECGKIFGSRSSQQIHARVHSGEKPYGCNFCDRAFADGGTLRKHERIHTGEKPYVCLICMRAFNQRVVLRDHIKSHHISVDPRYAGTSTPYCCSICNLLFSNAEEIHSDIVMHCDENTAKRRQPQIGPRKYKKRSMNTQRSDENFHSVVIKKKRGRKSKLEMQLEMEDWKKTVFLKEDNGNLDNVEKKSGDHKFRIFPGGEMNRPRTKNVSRPANDNFRFVPARFPDPKNDVDEISAAVESIKVKIEAYDVPEIQENFGRRGRRKIKEELMDI